MTSLVAINGHKRRKTSPFCSGLRITDLPDEAVSFAASFLSKPSRALFAAAMSAPSHSWRGANSEYLQTSTSRAIVSWGNTTGEAERVDGNRQDAQWATLDFADVEYSLASRLTDDDLAAALLCIDASRNLKSLKLSGCVNITGAGLKPLSHSIVLEQLDLSLVGKHEIPNIWPEPPLSQELVISLLDGIIASDGTSFKQLQLPKKMRSNPSPALDEFIERYTDLLECKGELCPRCNETDIGWGNMDNAGRPWIVDEPEDRYYGLQNFTCYECTAHYCVETCLDRCMTCEREYCTDCATLTDCAACDNRQCGGCGELQKCNTCDDALCDSCCSVRECCNKVQCEECAPYFECEYCNEKHCSTCFDYMNGNDNEKCVGCGVRACSMCRYLEGRRDPQNACTECVNIINKVWRLHEEAGRLPFGDAR